MYCLFDANVIAAYYCTKTTRSAKVISRARTIIESVRSKASSHFLYIPNFCIAEVFSVFMKYAYSTWNSHVKSRKLDRRVYGKVRTQFQEDIHNARLFYHYELSRYHVLAVNLVAPVDHHYRMKRRRRASKKKKASTKPVQPSGTLDQLLIAMGVHLVKIHGPNNVVVVTADERLAMVIEKCRSQIKYDVKQKLGLVEASNFTGIPFQPDSFPIVLNLQKASDTQLRNVFGQWPLPIAKKYPKPKLG